MEPGGDQYFGGWNYHLYIYAECGTVWGRYNDGDCDKLTDYTGVYADWAAVSKFNSACTTNNF